MNKVFGFCVSIFLAFFVFSLEGIPLSAYDIDQLRVLKCDIREIVDKRIVNEFYRRMHSFVSVEQDSSQIMFAASFTPKLPESVRRKVEACRREHEKYGKMEAAFWRVHWLCLDNYGEIDFGLVDYLLFCEKKRYEILKNTELGCAITYLEFIEKHKSFPRFDLGERDEPVCLMCGAFGFPSRKDHVCVLRDPVERDPVERDDWAREEKADRSD